MITFSAILLPEPRRLILLSVSRLHFSPREFPHERALKIAREETRRERERAREREREREREMSSLRHARDII